jgi:hypothetical protein
LEAKLAFSAQHAYFPDLEHRLDEPSRRSAEDHPKRQEAGLAGREASGVLALLSARWRDSAGKVRGDGIQPKISAKLLV